MEQGGDESDNTGPQKIVHFAIKKVTEDLEEQKYNTAVATMMKATNDMYELKAKEGFVGTNSWRSALESLVMLIAPPCATHCGRAFGMTLAMKTASTKTTGQFSRHNT